MQKTLPIVIPIFALILAGYICRKRQLLGETAASELNKFVVYLALPALLFDVLSHTQLSTLNQPRFLLAYCLSSALVFSGALALRLFQSRHIVDASIDSLGASYANTGFIGLPLCALTLGSESLAPAIIATILTVCVVFAAGVFFVELGLQQERHMGKVLSVITLKLLRNPLILAPLAGIAYSLCGFTTPAPAEQFLKLLGGAATPCALVSIGLFLAAEKSVEQKIPVPGARRNALFLVALKLIAQPALTWLLVMRVLPLPPIWANTAILMSALPTGTGPYMLAEFYHREAAMTSRVILLSTAASLITVSVLLGWLQP
ncbi:AEC family transporter [bacterium]|nr:MAG: AEC family transporter [bacterium]